MRGMSDMFSSKESTKLVREYYENGTVKVEWNYKNGRLEGVRKIYYRNGNPLAEGNYKDGKLEGTSKGYHENGALEVERAMKMER